MENNVTKRTRATEVTEYIATCDCGKKVIGSKESQVLHLLKVHQLGKECTKNE